MSQSHAASRIDESPGGLRPEERDLLDRLFAQAPGFMCVLQGPDHRFAVSNEAMRELAGGRPLDGRTVSEAFPDLSDQGIVQRLDEVYRSGEVLIARAFAIRLVREGRVDERFVDFIYQPMRDPSGRVTGVFVQGSDVTDSVLQERRAAEVLDRLTEGFAIVDRDLRILSINAAGQTIMGRPAAEVIGRTPFEFAPEMRNGYAERTLRAAAAEGASVTFEHFVDAPGYRRWNEVRTFPVREGLAVLFRDTTLRKEAEIARAMTAQRFRTATDAAPSLMWLSDSNGRNVFVNQAYSDYTGLPASALLGDDWMQVVHPNDLAAVAPKLQAAADEGEPFEAEYRFRRADGEWRWHLVRGVRNTGDEEHAWIGAATDIHERRLLEDRVRASEMRMRDQLLELQNLYDTAPIGLGVLDADLRFVRINERLAEINGIPARDHIGRSVRELLPKIADLAEPTLRQVLETGVAVLDLELRGETPAQPGVERIWRENFHPVRSEGGAVTGISIVCEEITERRRAQDALAASESRFRAMADNIDQLAWMASPAGEIFWFNKRWRDFVGPGPASEPGPGWRKVHHPDHAQRVISHFYEKIEAGASWEDTFPLRGANGEYRWFLSRAHPIRNERGAIMLWFGTNTDVTDARRSDEARALLAREVDHRAKNALAIVQSIVRLSRADTKEALVAGVSGRIAAMARAQSLLSHARWEGGDLHTLARAELSALAPPGAFALIGPTVTLAPDGVQAFVLIVHELATNAAKYGALSVPGGWVEVSWRQDEGRFLFCWRERGGPAASEPSRKGFGATMIEQLVTQQLGGDISPTWDAEGLTFEAHFPSSIVRDFPTAQPAARPPPAPPPPKAASQGQVLVVEDSAMIALDMAETLEGQGWTVVGPAYSVREGLTLAAAHADALACAVLDFDLQGESSSPIAEALEARGVPVVWCSGFDESAEARFAGRAHIQKPIDHDRLVRLVAQTAR